MVSIDFYSVSVPMVEPDAKASECTGIVSSHHIDVEQQKSSPYYYKVCQPHKSNGMESSEKSDFVEDNEPARKRVKRDTISSTSSIDDDIERRNDDVDQTGTTSMQSVLQSQSVVSQVTTEVYEEKLPVVSHALSRLNSMWHRNSAAAHSTLPADVITSSGECLYRVYYGVTCSSLIISLFS